MRAVSSTLVVIVLLLLCVGMVILASTSSVKGTATFDDPHYFLKRQLFWLVVSLVAGFLLSGFDYHWLQRLALPLFVVSIVLLVLVFIPRIGLKAGGSYRWIRLGPFSFQPSELAKFSTIVGLSAWMAHVGRNARRITHGLLIPMAALGVILVLLMGEPDFGTTLLTGTVGMLLLFAGGTRVSHLLVAGVAGVSAFIVAIFHDPVRMVRVLSFLSPEKYPDAAYHLQQSKLAFISGGWFGVGLGKSMQKRFYLPEAHTDFIFAIIGEELGYIASTLVVVLFVGILVCGMIIVFRAPDPFGKLLAFGITIMVTLQAAINIGVVTGCLPTKGLPLPFISYGGSSLLMSVAGIGVLLNIAQHAVIGRKDKHTRVIRDQVHEF